MVETTTHRHESYGLINLSRISCRNSAVMLDIGEARLERHLSGHWPFLEKIIPQVLLSPNQFAKAITRMNQGGDTPINLEYVTGDPASRREPPPESNKRQKFEAEIHRTLQDPLGRPEDLKEGLRTQRHRRKVDGVMRQPRSNIPFVEKQFAVQVEKTITEAKAEIEALINQRASDAGEEALRDHALRLKLAEGRP